MPTLEEIVADYEVRGFYKKPLPAVAGENGLAFWTWNKGINSRNMEIAAAKNRKDLALVQWRFKGANWADVK